MVKLSCGEMHHKDVEKALLIVAFNPLKKIRGRTTLPGVAFFAKWSYSQLVSAKIGQAPS